MSARVWWLTSVRDLAAACAALPRVGHVTMCACVLEQMDSALRRVVVERGVGDHGGYRDRLDALWRCARPSDTSDLALPWAPAPISLFPQPDQLKCQSDALLEYPHVALLWAESILSKVLSDAGDPRAEYEGMLAQPLELLSSALLLHHDVDPDGEIDRQLASDSRVVAEVRALSACKSAIDSGVVPIEALRRTCAIDLLDGLDIRDPDERAPADRR